MQEKEASIRFHSAASDACPSRLVVLGTVTPEFQVLIACGQSAITKNTADELSLPTETLSPEFVGQAWAHGLAPLAHRFLATRTDLSPPIQDLLRREAIGNLAENLRQVRGLRRAAIAFARAGIPWLCIKGPVTAVKAYNDPSLRPFSDIDLVIHLADFHRAYDCLVAGGFQPYIDVTPQWQARYFREHSQTTLHAGSKIDLH